MSAPRVFVSSVMDGFEAYRAAARVGIEAAGGMPMLIEDQPSLNASSRNACLDLVQSADVYLVIVGERGGWTADSSKLVVEEEYEEARRQGMPVLFFLKDGPHDEDAQRLARRLSDYVSGRFRVQFQTSADLEHEVERALTPLVNDTDPQTMESPAVESLIADAQPLGQGPSLHLALAPTRREEVIDPVKLESEDFRFDVYRLAHQRSVQLLSYERPKTSDTVRNALVITETAGAGRPQNAQKTTRLTIKESGDVLAAISLVRPVARNDPFGGGGLALSPGDIKAALHQAFVFCRTLYEEIDPHRRHEQFAYNAALANLGMRQIGEPSTFGAQTIPWQAQQRQGPIVAFDPARPIARPMLSTPDDEIERTLVLLKRTSREPPP